MPIQIISPKSTFAEEFGSALGGGLGIGAAKMFEKQVTKDKHARENAQLLEKGIDLRGYTDPKERQIALKEQLKAQAQENLMKKKNMAFSDIINKGVKEPGQIGEDRIIGKSKSPQLEGIGEEPQEKSVADILIDSREAAERPEFDAASLSDEDLAQIHMVDPEFAKALGNLRDVSLREKREKEKLAFDRLKHGYESNKDYINKITDAAEAADEIDMRLDQMLSLEDLPTPLMATTLEVFGLPPSLFSADAETAEKLSIDLTKNIQQFYGSRILQSEFQAFLKSIPTLKNTSEGRKRIVQNMKSFNELRRLEYTLMRKKELEYEQKEKPLPPSFRRNIKDELKPEINKIANEFKNSAKYSEPLKRKKVKSGTRISDELIDKYILDAKGNLDKARKNALEDGYDIE